MKMKLIAAAALAVAALPAAHAVDIKAGDWTVSVGGNINAFYTHSSCKQPSKTVDGVALGDASYACGNGVTGKDSSTVIGNGLLPSMLSVGAKTQQGGYDIAATIGIGVAAATHSAIEQNNVVDVRHAFVTFGNADMGTVKLGRDYGLFGLNPVLSDMTLLGVGAATKATQNGRVSLGHLGAGQVYPGTYGQIAYTTPSMSGLTVDAALVSPVDAASAATDTPQFQARVTYAGQGYKAWASVKSQKFETPTSFDMSATELGASFTSGPIGLVATVQSGNGLGILSDGDQGDMKTSNYFLQGTYQATDRAKIGLSVGKSSNDKGTGTGLHSNQNVTAGLYYGLTKSLTLVGEVGTTTSKAFSGASAKQNSVAFGGIFFF
jgi:predicted porin